jgi:hypothetical protein
MALADLYVQPGRHNSFEEYRLPGKVPEFFAMGRPVVLSSAGIADQFENESDAILLKIGDAEEIAKECMKLFKNSAQMKKLGVRSRVIALERYNMKIQAKKLESAHQEAIALFEYDRTKAIWNQAESAGLIEAALLKVKFLQLKSTIDSSLLVDQLTTWIKLINHRLRFISKRAVVQSPSICSRILDWIKGISG